MFGSDLNCLPSEMQHLIWHRKLVSSECWIHIMNFIQWLIMWIQIEIVDHFVPKFISLCWIHLLGNETKTQRAKIVPNP